MTEPVRNDAFEVISRTSDITLTVPPEKSILAAVEEAGVGVLSSCQEGTCGTCETPVYWRVFRTTATRCSTRTNAKGRRLHDDLRLPGVRRQARPGSVRVTEMEYRTFPRHR